MSTTPETDDFLDGAEIAQGEDKAAAKISNTAESEQMIMETIPSTDEDIIDGSMTPISLGSFDWSDFETRYQAALKNASEEEKLILKEAESLSRYFQVWASAASVHDDQRAVKRLQTRQRYVNLAEEKMEQKQQHYEEVVQAFESALALLRSS